MSRALLTDALLAVVGVSLLAAFGKAVPWTTNANWEAAAAAGCDTNSAYAQTHVPGRVSFDEFVLSDEELKRLGVHMAVWTNIYHKLEIPIYIQDVNHRVFATNYVDITELYKAADALYRGRW